MRNMAPINSELKISNCKGTKKTNLTSKTSQVKNINIQKVVNNLLLFENIKRHCIKHIPFVKLTNIAFDKSLCDRYNISFDVKVKLDEMILKDNEEYDTDDNASKKVKIEDFKNLNDPISNITINKGKQKEYNVVSRKRKKWPIQNMFHFCKITSKSCIFSANSLLIESNEERGNNLNLDSVVSTKIIENDLRNIIINRATSISDQTNLATATSKTLNNGAQIVMNISESQDCSNLITTTTQMPVPVNNNNNSALSSNKYLLLPQDTINKVSSVSSEKLNNISSTVSQKTFTSPIKLPIFHVNKNNDLNCVILSDFSENNCSKNKNVILTSRSSTPVVFDDSDIATDSIESNSDDYNKNSRETSSIFSNFVASTKIAVDYLKNEKELQTLNPNKSPDNKIKFKKPLLPVDKRPPTRRNSKADFKKNSTNLSLYNRVENHSNFSDMCLMQDRLPKNSFTCNPKDHDVISLCASTNFDDFPEYISDLHESQIMLSNEKQKCIENWLEISSHMSIPLVLKSVCKHYVKWNKCTFKNCHFLHDLPANVKNEISKLSLEEIQELVNYVKNNTHISNELLSPMITRLKYLEESTYLINLIDDILDTNILDKTPYISMIITALQCNNQSLQSVVHGILLVHGNQKYVLSDILLSIIVNSEESLINNWSCVTQLVKFRENLDFGVIGDMLQKCMMDNPVNLSLLRHICEDILLKLPIQFEKIRDIMSEFIRKLGEFKMFEYAGQIAEKCEFVLDEFSPTIGHSNSTTSSFERNYPVERQISPLPLNSVDSEEKSVESNDISPNYLEETIQDNNFSAYSKLLLNCSNLGAFIQKSIHLFQICQIDVYEFFIKLTSYLHDMNNETPSGCRIKELGLNIIAILVSINEYTKALDIVHLFDNDLLLITKKVYVGNFINDYVLKYLMLIKIFMKNGVYSKTWALLESKDWNTHLTNKKFKDIVRRRVEGFVEICREFIQTLIDVSKLNIARKLAMFLIENDLFIEELNLWPHFNTILWKLLHYGNEYKAELWAVIRNILKGWSKCIHRDIMRMLLILFFQDLVMLQRIDFYCICRNAGLYMDLKGCENLIQIPRDLTINECHLILHMYFENMYKSKHKLTNATVQIVQPIEFKDSLFLEDFKADITIQSLYRLLKEKLDYNYIIRIQNNDTLLLNLTSFNYKF